MEVLPPKKLRISAGILTILIANTGETDFGAIYLLGSKIYMVLPEIDLKGVLNVQ